MAEAVVESNTPESTKGRCYCCGVGSISIGVEYIQLAAGLVGTKAESKIKTIGLSGSMGRMENDLIHTDLHLIPRVWES